MANLGSQGLPFLATMWPYLFFSPERFFTVRFWGKKTTFFFPKYLIITEKSKQCCRVVYRVRKTPVHPRSLNAPPHSGFPFTPQDADPCSPACPLRRAEHPTRGLLLAQMSLTFCLQSCRVDTV